MTESTDERPSKDPAPAVGRSIRLLETLADHSGLLSLTELANELGLPKSSTLNLCLSLEAADMVQRVGRSYRLGKKVAELGGAFVTQFQQIREFYSVCDASPVLRHELVQVAMLDGVSALYLARHEGASRGRYGTPLGSKLPAALSAAGRALLMGLEDEEITDLLAAHAPFPQLTANSPTTIPELLERVRKARASGWALDAEESFPGIIGVATPLDPWTPGDPPLALGVGMVAANTSAAHVEDVAQALMDAAAVLTNPLSATAQRKRISTGRYASLPDVE